MGQIAISIKGSFHCTGDCLISAETSGHTVALEDAIKWLTVKRLSAEAQDKALREAGHSPVDKWAEYDKRHPQSSKN